MAREALKKTSPYDVAIVGAGLSGFSAAVSCVGSNRRVLVLSNAPGASSLSSGAWDMGPVPRLPLEAPLGFGDCRNRPEWHAIETKILIDGQWDFGPEHWEANLTQVAKALAPDLPMTFAFDRSLVLPTSVGTWKRVFASQAIQAAADIGHLKGKRVGVVASRQWRFPSELVASSWQSVAQAGGVDLHLSLIWLELKGADWPMPQLASRLLDDFRFRDLFLDSLRAALQVQPQDTLLFPPLFLDLAYVSRMEKELGVRVAECLAYAEPIPGQRLKGAVERALGRLGVDRVVVSGLRGVASGSRIANLSGGQNPFSASHFVLASGRFLGGGIELRGPELKEAVLGLPLFFSREKPFEDYSHHTAELGLRLNRDWRPTDESGKAIFENVVACGSLCGGVDYPAHSLGLGFFAHTGMSCGRAA